MRSPLALWSPVEVRATVTARPEDVFDVITEPRTYPEWLVGAQRIRHVDRSFPAPGAEFEHSVGPSDALTVDDSTESVAVDQDRRLVLEVRAGFVRGEVEFVLTAHGEEETEIVLRERPIGPGAAVTPLLRPFLAGRNRESLRQLGRLLELRA